VDAGLFTARSLPQLTLQRFGPARHHPAVITRPSSWRRLLCSIRCFGVAG